MNSQESDITMDGRRENGAMMVDVPERPYSPPAAVAPPIHPPIPGQTGLALCAPLTDERLSEYRIPSGTAECGTNCIACTLLLLGWISREDAEKETGRCILALSGVTPHISFDEVVEAVRRWHPYYYGHRVQIGMLLTGEIGVRAGTLDAVLTQVPPGYGCFFVYGGPTQTHVVVIRRLPDGTPELIDPQRGSSVFSRYTPSDEFRAAHGINLQENYYSVRGEEHILATMVEQATLFGYFPTREEAFARMMFKIVTYTTI